MYSCNNPVNTELLSFPQRVILTLCSVFTGYIVSLRCIFIAYPLVKKTNQNKQSRNMENIDHFKKKLNTTNLH